MSVRFTDFYKKGKPALSVEIFPPKTEKGVNNLFSELEKLKQIKPEFVSVTYGAGGSTRNLTSDLALQVRENLNIKTAFHFTCVGSGREEMKEYVTALAKQDMNLIVALRGDKPQNVEEFVPPADGFRYANELVAYLKSLHPFSMAVAGYPEGHVEAPSLEEDLKNLKKKVDAGADVIITQLFYDNHLFYNYVEKVRAMGIEIPIVAGVLPIQSLPQIERFLGLCGSTLPDELRKKLEECGEDHAAQREIGVQQAIDQCRDLIKNGVDGIHFYCLNKSYSVLKIYEGIKDLL